MVYCDRKNPGNCYTLSIGNASEPNPWLEFDDLTVKRANIAMHDLDEVI